MNEQQLIEYWNLIRGAIGQLNDQIKSIEKKVDEYVAEGDKRINELRSVVYDEIINPANEYISKAEKDARFEDFDSKYGEKLRPYNDELSALEGEDFDIVRSAFDKYDDWEGDKMGEDEYVDALIEEVGKQLSDIKKKLGIPADTDISVEETGDGEVAVVTEDGEVVASSEEEEEPVNVEIAEDEEAEDDPEEVAAFEQELLNQK